MEKQDCFLTRNETNFIKAVAIIMMLMHHFWGFPAWRIGGAALEPAVYLPGGASLSWMAALQFKICVAMFAVITGYGWGKGQVSLRKTAKRVGKVLLAYEWCLAAEYILNGLAAPESVSLRDLLDQITLCFFHGELLIRFAWYVRFFILAAFSYLAFVRLMRACPIPVGLSAHISCLLSSALPRRNGVGMDITPQTQKPVRIKTGRLFFCAVGSYPFTYLWFLLFGFSGIVL